jgi:hypothetical protein
VKIPLIITVAFLLSACLDEKTPVTQPIKEIWISAEPLISEWTIKEKQDISSWVPDINNQTENFEQTKESNIIYKRKIQEREQEKKSGDYRITKQYVQYRTDKTKLSRNIIIDNTGLNDVVNCTTWLPSNENYYDYEEIDQERICTITETTIVNYRHNYELLETNEFKTEYTQNENQVVAGLKETINVSLYWSKPLERMSGELMDESEIGGYHVRYFDIDNKSEQENIILDENMVTYYIDNLPKENTYQFEVAVFDTNGIYSNFVIAE